MASFSPEPALASRLGPSPALPSSGPLPLSYSCLFRVLGSKALPDTAKPQTSLLYLMSSALRNPSAAEALSDPVLLSLAQ